MFISSVDNTPLDVTRSPAEGIPAEFTTTWIDPNSLTVYYTRPLTSSSSDTSVL